MTRHSIAATIAIAVALAGASFAQETTTVTKTTTKSEKGKSVRYTGCLRTNGESEGYVLNKVGALSQKKIIGFDGTTQTTTTSKATTTTFTLMPGETAELRDMVGHEVEVTGLLIPAERTEIKTRTERDGSEGVTVTSTTAGASPEFRVTSIRQLTESCS